MYFLEVRDYLHIACEEKILIIRFSLDKTRVQTAQEKKYIHHPNSPPKKKVGSEKKAIPKHET